MILEHSHTANASDIEQALKNAQALFPSKWLLVQHSLPPNDPLLAHLIPDSTPRQALSGIRQGFSGRMHPLAECILIGQTVIDCYRKDGNLRNSRSLHLLFSLNDIAKASSSIPLSDLRIRKLQEPNWKSTIYELLVAASYVNWAKPEFLQEGPSPSPDLKLSFPSTVYIECKARLKHEEQVDSFRSTWRKGPLTTLIDFLSRVNDAGFLVKIRVNQNTKLATIPKLVKRMVAEKRGSLDITGGHIEVERYSYDTIKLSKSMPMSAEFWKLAIGFSEWREWHDIFEGGDFTLSNQSNLIIQEVHRPLLICVRADNLADNTPKVLNALKYACSRQFKSYNPGMIHVLLNTKQFGLGELSEFHFIYDHLSQLTNKLFADYSRVWKIMFDVVTPPELGEFFGEVRRVGFTSGRCEGPLNWQKEPGAVLLW